jgi:hypothetical protein
VISLWAMLACTIPLDLGDACGLVQVSEVLTANITDDLPLVGDSDFFEVHNRDRDAEVNLRGYVFHGEQSRQPMYEVGRDVGVPPDGYQVFEATVYCTYVDGACVEDDVVISTQFDFNNDGDAVYMWGPSGQLCEEAVVPDQHVDHSWQRDPSEPDVWCDASVPSPGRANEPCFCEVSDGC